MSRTALCIGGPKHMMKVEIQDGARQIPVLIYPQETAASVIIPTEEREVPFKTVIYEPTTICGAEVWVPNGMNLNAAMEMLLTSAFR